ncbi:helix-turn-helix domain-containing protein [Terriglobus roseus]|uniref:AraC family transcriptional regulator n=1 Tax=Terriglobus roseus TaxID=392734 RepID=A0A1G7KS14_9BACT|nr:AraC family transcriptional regulator [Terriglobus roseus]SDF39965.1 AraC family transcriptional regulator [Terriglobus roseus]
MGRNESVTKLDLVNSQVASTHSPLRHVLPQSAVTIAPIHEIALVRSVTSDVFGLRSLLISIGVIPAGMEGSWEDDADCQILRLSFQPSLLEEVAEQMGRNSSKVDLAPRFALRDTRIEAIGWAIKEDLEADTPADPLYIELLTNALAVRLVELAFDRASHGERSHTPRLSARQLRILIDYIETNLDQRLHLADLESIAGVGTTRLKTLFRNSTGTPVHRYVIGRRIEYARAMLSTTKMPASQIALAAGFTHQSHMSSTMRRVLGHAPSEIPHP